MITIKTSAVLAKGRILSLNRFDNASRNGIIFVKLKNCVVREKQHPRSISFRVFFVFHFLVAEQLHYLMFN